MVKTSHDLFGEIALIGGKRMVTVSTAYMGTKTYDMDAEGTIGYCRSHLPLLLEHLEEALGNGGGVFVRQFSLKTCRVKTSKGIMILPVKNLYGLVCGGGRALGLSKEQVQEVSTTDHQTGQTIEAEPGVAYLDWPG
jgi:hypothetical protein